MLSSVDRNLKRYVGKDGGMIGISIAKTEDDSWRVSFYKVGFASSSSSSGVVLTRTVKSIPVLNEKIEILSRFTSDMITNGILGDLNKKHRSANEKLRLQVVLLILILVHNTVYPIHVY